MAKKTNYMVTLLLLVFALVFILGPLYMTIVIALKDQSEMTNILALPKTINWQNFADAWRMTDFPSKFKNTFIITIVNLFFTILSNSLVAYVITRQRKKSRFFNMIFYYFISAMFIPFNVLMLPLVRQAGNFHLDNIAGITLLYIIFGLPQNIFLYHGFIKKIPESLDEAAKIDGASASQIFFHIIFPILKPMHATVGILSVMWTWNDFLMPLVILSNPKDQTLQLSQYIFQGEFNTQYNLAFASYLMVILPVLLIYFVFQKDIIDGVTKGALK